MKVNGLDTVGYKPDYSKSKEENERIFNDLYRKYDEKPDDKEESQK